MPSATKSTEYGAEAVKSLLTNGHEENKSVRKLSAEEELVLKTFRILIADLCQQFNGGHPGSAFL
jgi:dihydroxyacetone synthase